MSTDVLRECKFRCNKCKIVLNFRVVPGREGLLRCLSCGGELKEFKIEMKISEEQAKAILEAFNRLQLEDFLSRDQRVCALAIMDFYPILARQYSYLRNPYGEDIPIGG